MLEFFHHVLYAPIYNLLIFFVGAIPGGDVGIAVILVTVLIKAAIMPLSLSAVRTQKAMRVLEPELRAIKERFKSDPQKQAEEMFALYRKYNIKPFASLLTLIIQIPVLLALFFVFQNEALPHVDESILYSFISIPLTISPLFLGLLAVKGPSIVLAIVAAGTQFLHARFAIPIPERSKEKTPSMQEEFGRAMAVQARFALPLIIGVVAYSSGAIALYFITSNLVMMLQEYIVRRMPHAVESAKNSPHTDSK